MTLPLLIAVALAATNIIHVRSVDSVAAFSEDGRSALIQRIGVTTGGGNSQSWLLLSLDAPPQLFEISQIGASSRIAMQLLDQSECRENARELQRAIEKDFFGVASVNVGACARPGRDVVDVKRNLRVRPLTGEAINSLIAKHGIGNYVASREGPIVVHLVSDVQGNVVVAKPIERAP